MATLVNLYQRIIHLWNQPYWWAESWSCFVVTGWAISNIIDHSLEHTAFTSLTELAPVYVWLYGALFIGLFQGCALLLNNRVLRAIASFFCTWFLCIILFHFIARGILPASLSLYFGYIGINLMAMYKHIRGTA